MPFTVTQSSRLATAGPRGRGDVQGAPAARTSRASFLLPVPRVCRRPDLRRHPRGAPGRAGGRSSLNETGRERRLQSDRTAGSPSGARQVRGEGAGPRRPPRKTRGQEVDPEGQRGPAKGRSGAHLLMRGETVTAAAGRPQQLLREATPRRGPRAGAPAADGADAAVSRGRAVATSRGRSAPRGCARDPRALPQGGPPSPEPGPGSRIPGPSRTDAPHRATDPNTPKPTPSPE